MTEFSTTKFEFSHGKKPRGFGVWGFDFEEWNGCEMTTDTVFTPHAMSFTAAKVWFKARTSRRSSVRNVSVAS